MATATPPIDRIHHHDVNGAKGAARLREGVWHIEVKHPFGGIRTGVAMDMDTAKSMMRDFALEVAPNA